MDESGDWEPPLDGLQCVFSVVSISQVAPRAATVLAG